MSHELSETVQTVQTDTGRVRVTISPDDCSEAPYNDGGSPVVRVDYGRRGWTVEQDTDVTSYVLPDTITNALEAFLERHDRGTAVELWERYVRAFHGVRDVVWFRSNVDRGGCDYVTLDPQHWRTQQGLTDEYLREHAEHFTGPLANADEYVAWLDGDVWFHAVEREVTYRRVDGDEEITRWEDVEDGTCHGFYGEKWAREAALEALRVELEIPYERTVDGDTWAFVELHDDGTVTYRNASAWPDVADVTVKLEDVRGS